MGRNNKISVTELIEFICKRRWYLHRIEGHKGSPLIHFVIGKAVHNFIAYWLHKEVKSGREFYYKSEGGALNAFGRYWYKEVHSQYKDEFNGGLLHWSKEEAKRNIKNYIKTVAGRGRPLKLEKSFDTFVPKLGITLTGNVDQIRSTNPLWAKQNGITNPTQVIVDLKTGKPQYWPTFGGVTMEDIQKAQTGLINNVQATMYYLLFEQKYGYYPDAFLFMFLGGGEPSVVHTTRSQVDFDNMFDIINDFLKNTQAMHINEYPKTANTYMCGSCQYWKACWPEKERPDINPPINFEGEIPVQDEEKPLPEKPKQLRLKLRTGRRAAND